MLKFKNWFRVKEEEPIKELNIQANVAAMFAELHELQPDATYVLWFKERINPVFMESIRRMLGAKGIKHILICGTPIPEIYKFERDTYTGPYPAAGSYPNLGVPVPGIAWPPTPVNFDTTGVAPPISMCQEVVHSQSLDPNVGMNSRGRAYKDPGTIVEEAEETTAPVQYIVRCSNCGRLSSTRTTKEGTLCGVITHQNEPCPGTMNRD